MSGELEGLCEEELEDVRREDLTGEKGENLDEVGEDFHDVGRNCLVQVPGEGRG